MSSTAYFRSARSNLPRWQDLCNDIIHNVPALNYAGHHFSLHHIEMGYELSGRQIPPHKQSYYEGVVILSGSCEETTGQKQHLAPGTMLINPPEILHGWETLNSSVLRLIIWFTVDKPLEFKANTPHPVDKQAIHAVAGLLEAARSAQPGWPDCAAARLLLLMASITQSVEWPAPGEKKRPRKTQNVGAMVNDFLRINISRPIILRDIAAHCGLSIPTLTRHLRQEGHAGAMSTLQRFRMEWAFDLVRNSTMATGEIARKIGMPDSRYFNRCFREQYGCSPGQLRANSGRLPSSTAECPAESGCTGK